MEVIELLIGAGADPNVRNRLSPPCSPLTLVLIRGASTTSVGAQLIGQPAASASAIAAGLGSPVLDGNSSNLNRYASSLAGAGEDDVVSPPRGSGQDIDRARSTARRIWVKAAEKLMKLGNPSTLSTPVSNPPSLTFPPSLSLSVCVRQGRGGMAAGALRSST